MKIKVKPEIRTKYDHPNKKQLEKSTINIRISKTKKDKLIEKAGTESNLTELMESAADKYILEVEKKEEEQRCGECDKPIKLSETYYTENASIEKRTILPNDIKIEVIQCAVTLILCMKCAKEKGKIKQLEELMNDPEADDEYVKDYDRTETEK